ncbi:MAG TPA: hypothetical protein VFA96_02305, partial [Nocardioides sp.]|nr:hypothetical protein [Nocardioides sp.]
LSGGVIVAITQLEEGGHGRHILCVGPGRERRWEPLTPGAFAEPTLALDDEEAVLLMNALVSHYQGVDDQRALRKDYDDERRRVDKLTDALVGIAQKATGA